MYSMVKPWGRLSAARSLALQEVAGTSDRKADVAILQPQWIVFRGVKLLHARTKPEQSSLGLGDVLRAEFESDQGRD